MTRGQTAEEIIKRICRERLAQPDQKWHAKNWRKIWKSAIVDELKRCGESVSEGTDRAKEIYQLYPRKVAPKRAYKPIEAAIKDHGYDHIKEKTEAYALAVSTWSIDWRFRGTGGSDIVPHPASWFNAGSYDDDPKEWIGDRKYNTPQVEEKRTKRIEAPYGWQEAFLGRYDDWEASGNGVRRIADQKYFGWSELPAYIQEEFS